MKKIILFMAILLMCVNTFSQKTTGSKISKTDYLQKSRNQETGGWILLGGGTAMIVVGGIGFNKTDFWSSDSDVFAALFLGGIFTDFASIPFFIISAKSARRAASITLNNQQILFPDNAIIKVRTQPAVTLKIHL
jgi:hypothetical protein